MSATEKKRRQAILTSVFNALVKEVGEDEARVMWRNTIRRGSGTGKQRSVQYDRLLASMWVAYNTKVPRPGANELYRLAAALLERKTGQSAQPASVIRRLKFLWPAYRSKRQREYGEALARALLGNDQPAGMLSGVFQPPRSGE